MQFTKKNLIGRKCTRGGTCEYTFVDANKEDHILLVWHSGNQEFPLTSVQEYLKGAIWKLVPEKELAEQVAQNLYDQLVQGNWSYEDILDLRDKTVYTMLTTNEFKARRIRQIIQNLNEKRKTSRCSSCGLQGRFENNLCDECHANLTENNTKEITMNTLSIEVPNAPYAVTETITVFQQNVNNMSEQDLYNALTRIQKEEDTLKALGTKQASKRITRKIKELVDARTKVITLIDALDD